MFSQLRFAVNYVKIEELRNNRNHGCVWLILLFYKLPFRSPWIPRLVHLVHFPQALLCSYALPLHWKDSICNTLYQMVPPNPSLHSTNNHRTHCGDECYKRWLELADRMFPKEAWNGRLLSHHWLDSWIVNLLHNYLSNIILKGKSSGFHYYANGSGLVRNLHLSHCEILNRSNA